MNWMDRASTAAASMLFAELRDIAPMRSDDGCTLGHLRWMAEELAAKRLDSETKACRWLGWLQAGLVWQGLSTLDAEKRRNLTTGTNERFERLRAFGCVCCRLNREHLTFRATAGLTIEIHHLNAGGHHGGKRRGDEFTVPLCSWHHRGSFNASAMPGGHSGQAWADLKAALYGPAWAQGSRRFRGVYPNDDDLLRWVNERISERAAA